MADEHQPVDEYSQSYQMSIDAVDVSQYIEVDEHVEGTADGNEYESLEIFVQTTFDIESVISMRITVMHKVRGLISINGLQRFRTSKEIIKRYYTCNKEGFERQNPREEGREHENIARLDGCRVGMEIAVTPTS